MTVSVLAVLKVYIQIDWVEKRLSGFAKCLERLRTLARRSVKDFCMHAYYGRVGAIPT